MGTIRVSSDPFGRAIKKALEHLQQHHADGTFGYFDMPPLDEDYRVDANRTMLMFRASGGVALASPEKMANSSILEELKGAAIVETAGYEEFRLTDKGKTTSVHF